MNFSLVQDSRKESSELISTGTSQELPLWSNLWSQVLKRPCFCKRHLNCSIFLTSDPQRFVNRFSTRLRLAEVLPLETRWRNRDGIVLTPNGPSSLMACSGAAPGRPSSHSVILPGPNRSSSLNETKNRSSSLLLTLPSQTGSPHVITDAQEREERAQLVSEFSPTTKNGRPVPPTNIPSPPALPRRHTNLDLSVTPPNNRLSSILPSPPAQSSPHNALQPRRHQRVDPSLGPDARSREGDERSPESDRVYGEAPKESSSLTLPSLHREGSMDSARFGQSMSPRSPQTPTTEAAIHAPTTEAAMHQIVRSVLHLMGACRKLTDEQVDRLLPKCSITACDAHQSACVAQVYKNNKLLGTLSQGKYFGDVYAESAMGTVVTAVPCELVLISLELVDDALHPHLEVNAQLSDVLFIPTKIGEGEFAEVFPCMISCCSSEPLAVKCIKKSNITGKKMQRQVTLEVSLLKMMKHPTIIELVTVLQDRACLYLVTELCDGGEFVEYMFSEATISEAHSQFYIANVILAIQHIHKQGVIYRDLKPENLVFTRHGFLKLVDFGFATQRAKCFTVCGTPSYMAPEIVSREGYGAQVDYWCMGILVFEMLFGYTPFEVEVDCVDEIRQTFDKIMHDGLHFPDEASVSHEVITFMKSLLIIDQHARLGDGVREHQWFKQTAFCWGSIEDGSMSPPFVPNSRTLSKERVPYADVHTKLLSAPHGSSWK